MNPDQFKTFLETIARETLVADQDITADLVSVASMIGDETMSFLKDNSIASVKSNGCFVATEAFGQDALCALGGEAISGLVEAAKIPANFRAQAIESIAIILGRNLGGDSSMAWSGQSKTSDSNRPGAGVVGLESLYTPAVAADYANGVVPSSESFGVNSDRALSDMKMAISISLLKWHTTLTPRVLSVLGTAQSQVLYVKETIEVYNLDDTDTETTTTLVDLYSNPDLVTNELKVIEVLLARDTDNQLVADSIIKFNEDVNILKLSIDPAKYGYTKINRTDLVADGVKLAAVHFTLADGTDTESFRVEIPETHGRLTRLTNGETVDRAANVVYKAVLQNAVALTSAGAPSVILAKLGDADDAVIVTLNIKPNIDLRTGRAQAMATMTLKSGNIENATPNAASDAEVVLLVGEATTVLDGYELDARHSEENLRKTSIAATNHRSQLAYDIASGKNYVMDYALTDNEANAASNVANLNNIIRIGQDNRVLNAVESTLIATARDVAAYNADPDNKQSEPGRFFAAGSKVRPTTIEATLDLTTITSIRDADRFGDVKQRVLSFFTAITAEIHAKSFFVQQLTSGAKATYRLITTNEVLSNVMGVPHTHDHLNRGKVNAEDADRDGVELKVVLPNGVILECITTTFAKWENKIMIIPTIPGAPKSDLNFGHNWDFGTMVGHYAHTGDASANQRIFANAREMPIPTNAIGAIIDVVGIENATFRV
jgi:hypothetical protein